MDIADIIHASLTIGGLAMVIIALIYIDRRNTPV